jgi:tetratricopeptide (TPR) repeat protein
MAKQQQPSNAAPASSGDNRSSRLAALRAAVAARLPHWSRRTKIALAIGVLVVTAHAVVLVVWVPKHLKSQAQQPSSLPLALRALDRHAWMEAKAIAANLKHSERLDENDRGGVAFVLGAVAGADAETLPEADCPTAYQSAAQYLEEARTRGFPEGRQAQGLFLLGKSLCLSGKYSASRAPLEESIHADAQSNPEAHYLLAYAYCHGADADWNQARHYSAQYLRESSVSQEQRDQGLLLNAKILDHLGDAAGCQAMLAQIPATSVAYAGAELLKAELLMREAHAQVADTKADAQQRAEAQSKYQQAEQKLKLVQSRGNVAAAVALRAMYLTGECEMEDGDLAAAQDQFRRVREQSPASDEGVAAAFQAADLLRREGRNEEAVSLLRKVVQAVGDPTIDHNDLLSVEAVRQRLLAVYEEDLQASQFDEAAQIARLLQPLFPPQRELELTGELLRAAAKLYLLKAESAPADQAKILAAKGRADLRRAGQTFAKLADLHSTSRIYADDLWNAAECFLQGHDYTHAADSLDLYLKTEFRRRRAAALLMLGEARLTLGDTDKAMSALQECLDAYPSDPASYQARLLMAKADVEKGDTAKAEELLRANLEGGQLTPRSAEWRDSLFALGSLLAMAGRYEDAIGRLEEAVNRYPDAVQANETRYLIADSYRRLASQARQNMEQDTVENLRITHAKQRQQYLNSALDQYRQIATILARLQQENNANSLDRAILRNCYFASGATLYDLARYDDAIRVYSEAANLCHNEPESLEAFVQMAACYRKLNQPEQARGAISQAKATLQRIDNNANFALTTIYTRDQWSNILNQMAEL